MKTKIMIILIFTALFLFTGLHTVNANCGRYGKIVRMYESSTSGTTYVQMAPQTITPFYYYYFYVTDSDMKTLLANAQASGRTVYVYGDIDECPTTTTGSFHYLGNALSVNMYTNY